MAKSTKNEMGIFVVSPEAWNVLNGTKTNIFAHRVVIFVEAPYIGNL